MNDALRVLVASRILNASLELFKENAADLEQVLSLDGIYKSLVEPPNPEMGDLAFGCFNLAKALKKGPPVIAGLLAKFIKPDEVLMEIKNVGPYLNVSMTMEAIGNDLLDPMRKEHYFRFSNKKAQEETKGKIAHPIMIEFSQPNTHKEIHVGHMRNLCLGDALVRLLQYAGHAVITSTFPGDMGTHVAKCLWYMKYHNTEIVPEHGKGEWLGKMYSRGHLKLEDDDCTEREPVNRAQLTSIIKEIESKNGAFYELFKETRQWSIDLMNEVYVWAGVHFDHWYWESEVDETSTQLVKKYFEEGKLVRSEGAIGMDLSADNLGFCLLLKSDGTGLYATKDVELARRKFEDYHIEKSLYVVDMRQALHFKQVFKVLERLGYPEAKQCYHLQYNYVELPDGAMSSRKGNIIPLFDLIQKMEEMVRSEYLVRYKAEWSENEISEVASVVAKGAIRYGMLKMDTNKKIVFDMNEWLKLDGESGPFIQYSYARIASLCRKMIPSGENTEKYLQELKVNWTLLKHPAELKLVKSLMHFNPVVNTAAESYKPAAVCGYIYDLAKRFNAFYQECPIGQAESVELKHSRLALAFAAGHSIKHGLALLGIPVPERM